jgi:hypothetical protein
MVAGNLFSCREMLAESTLAKLDSYGPNRFGALSARPEV